MKRTGKTVGVVVVVLAVVAATVMFVSTGATQEKAVEGRAASSVSKVNVVLRSVENRTFEDVLAVSGEVEAKTTSLVSSRIEYAIKDIFVDEGDPVVAGETKLFQVDPTTLEQNVGVAREQVSVAECTVREKEANLAQVQADYNKAKIDYERYKRLYEEDKAVTKNAFEVQESRFLQLSAALEHAKVLVELSGKQHQQAVHLLAIAEKDLADSLVYAPISGFISHKFVEPGEMAKFGEPIVAIENPQVVEISAWLPDEYYARIRPGQTPMRVRVGQTSIAPQAITYRSPTVTNDLRTFEVKTVVTTPPSDVVPGRIANIEVVFEAHEGLGVPSEALVERASGPVVFVVEGDTAKMVSVKTGLSTDGWTHIVEGAIEAGDAIVVMGQEELDDGDGVNVVEGR